MQQKLLYQKLEKKVNELEKKLTEAQKRKGVMKETVEKYRQLFENESDAVMVFDAETLRFEDANRATLNLYGYSKQEFLALNVEDISAEKEKTRVAVQKLKTEEPGSENLSLRYFRKKDGAVFPGEICAGIFISSDRKKIIGAVRDITERKQAEKTLRESEERYRTAIENSNDGVAIMKGDNHLYVNRKFAKIFGYERPEEVVEKSVSMFVHPDDRERVANFNRFRQQGKPSPSRYECKGIRKDGDTIYLSISANKTALRGEPVSLVFLRDISDQKQAEEVLKRERQEYMSIFDSIDEIVYVSDPATYEILYVNAAIKALFGNDIVGKKCYETFQNIDKPCDFCTNPMIFGNNTGKPYIWEFKNEVTKRWYRCIDKAIRWPDGRMVRYEMAVDIHDRKLAEEALLENKETLKAILAVCPVGVGLVRNRTLDWANAAMYRILGYQEGSLLGEDARVLYPDDDEGNRAGRALYPGMDETGIGQTETRWITKDGGVIDCHLQASPLDPNDPGKGHIVAAMDITDRKRADERIHTLTQQLMKAQENERQRISLYLHDDVAQNLSTLKMGLETIFDDQPTPPRELTQRVSKFSQILQTAISAVRDLAYDQRPPTLDQLGLVQAVFQYCESFSRKHGLRVDFQSAGMDDLKLDFDTEINLYRLIQEALTNVKKHADASRATVRLVATHPNIILRIEDDGKGFDVEGRLLRALDEKRMGLQGMEERGNLLNGKLRIQSRMGEGTRIFIEVPYKEKRVGSEKKHPNH